MSANAAGRYWLIRLCHYPSNNVNSMNSSPSTQDAISTEYTTIYTTTVQMGALTEM